jgi:hypothetical protein
MIVRIVRIGAAAASALAAFPIRRGRRAVR